MEIFLGTIVCLQVCEILLFDMFGIHLLDVTIVYIFYQLKNWVLLLCVCVRVLTKTGLHLLN